MTYHHRSASAASAPITPSSALPSGEQASVASVVPGETLENSSSSGSGGGGGGTVSVVGTGTTASGAASVGGNGNGTGGGGLTPMQCFARDCQALVSTQQVIAVEFPTQKQVPLEQVLILAKLALSRY